MTAGVASVGAGEEMAVRLATNPKGLRFTVVHAEVSEVGRAHPKAKVGVVLMAAPDRLIGANIHEAVGAQRPGAMVVILDAAAPHAGEPPARADVSDFVTHPRRPPIFAEETDAEAKVDVFAGAKARQHVVCAVMQSLEAHHTLGEEVARAIYAPRCAPIAARWNRSRSGSPRCRRRSARGLRCARPLTRRRAAASPRRPRATACQATRASRWP